MKLSSVVKEGGGDGAVRAASGVNDGSHEECQILILTEAGKPVFHHRVGDRDNTETDTAEVARIAGLLQALRASMVVDDDSEEALRLGDWQAFQSGSLSLVFVHVQSITLVAMRSTNPKEQHRSPTEVFLRVVLEYVYAQLIMAWTERVQHVLQVNSGYDLADMLDRTTERLLRHFLNSQLLGNEEDSSSSRGVTADASSMAPLWLAATPMLTPLPPSLRHTISHVLWQTATTTPDIVFAMVVAYSTAATTSTTTQQTCSSQSLPLLVSLVQPDYPPHQIRPSDMYLLLRLVGTQLQKDDASSSWFPVCLPRFHATGWLHVYTTTLWQQVEEPSAPDSNPTTNVTTTAKTAMPPPHNSYGKCNSHRLQLILITTHGTSEQLQRLQSAAVKIRRNLDFPEPTTTPTPSAATLATPGQDMDDEEDYVDASGEGDQVIPYVGTSDHPPPLVEAVQTSLRLHQPCQSVNGEQRRDGWDEWLETAQAVHFSYRYDASLHPYSGQEESKQSKFRFPFRQNDRNQQSLSSLGHFSQSLTSPLRCRRSRAVSVADLWSTYQRLSLRLRLGSASDESVHDALGMIQATTKASDARDNPGVGRHTAFASALVESPPRLLQQTHEINAQLSSQQPQKNQPLASTRNSARRPTPSRQRMGYISNSHGVRMPNPASHNNPNKGKRNSEDHQSGLSYILRDEYLFMAMYGPRFELYWTVDLGTKDEKEGSSAVVTNGSTLSSATTTTGTRQMGRVEKAALLGAKLVRRFQMEEDRLFLRQPLVFVNDD